jgi:hypothetical protein
MQGETLPDVAAVVFDEAHERSLDIDLALALCLDLQQLGRPELRYSHLSYLSLHRDAAALVARCSCFS